MFREMRRKNQQLSQRRCVELLKTHTLGVLSVLGDDQYPYGTPINYWYDENTNALYFHTSKKGHRNDAMKQHEKASFCIVTEGVQRADHWSKDYESVIVFGRVFEVKDKEQQLAMIRALSLQFTDDQTYIEQEIESSFSAVYCFGLKVEHMSGKTVNES